MFIDQVTSQRNSDNRVPDITVLMCADTNSYWTGWQLIQMWSAVTFGAHITLIKKLNLRCLKCGVAVLVSVTSQPLTSSAMLLRSSFGRFPAFWRESRQVRRILSENFTADNSGVTGPLGASPAGFPHMRSNGVFEVAVPSATRLWSQPFAYTGGLPL